MNDIPGNLDPNAQDDVVSTAIGTSVSIDVTANDSDPDGDFIGVTFVSTPGNGTVEITGDGTVLYTPDPGFEGTDTFTYEIDDGRGGQDTATVTVSVGDGNGGGGNTPPMANDDAATTTEGTAVTVDVLANDTDPDGDVLGVSAFEQPANGTVTQADPHGPLTYTPDPGFTGTDTIRYEVDDGMGGTDWGELVVTVTEGGGGGRDGIVTGTAGDDLIDIDYTGDPDTPPDRIDNEDAIIGDDAPNDDRVVAGGGNDTVRSGEGSDTVEAGDGDDVVETGNADPRIDTDVFPVEDLPPGSPFTQADDPLDGRDEDPDPEDDRDWVDGGAGNDTIRTGDDRDTIFGGTGADVIEGGIDDDWVDGGDGDDRITDEQGSDTIYGGAGHDTIIAGIDTYTDAPTGQSVPLGFEADPNPNDGRDLIAHRLLVKTRQTLQTASLQGTGDGGPTGVRDAVAV